MKNIVKTFLKLPYKSIDIDVINYVIEDILNNGNTNYTDDEIINIIKAFCYKLNCMYYTDISVLVVSQEKLDKLSKLSNVEGLLKDKTVCLEKNVVLDIRNGNIEVLRIIMHEVNHIKQRHMLEFNDISYKAYLLIMEQIIILEMDDKYYSDNYKYFFEEIDSRLEAEFNLYDYLVLHCPNIVDLEIDDICDNVSKCEEEADNLFRVVNDKKYEREELFDKIIRKKPEYIEAYPLLNFYYNSDGTKITIGEIIARINCKVKNFSDKKIAQKVKKLDSYIIKNRRGSKLNLQNDIKSLIMLEYARFFDKTELDNLINYLNECAKVNDSGYMNEIYDALINKIDIFRNKVSSTIDTTNKIATKIYLMMQNMGK